MLSLSQHVGGDPFWIPFRGNNDDLRRACDEVDPDLFWQIHRSTLVNTNCIAGVTRDLRGRQIVSIKGNNEKLEVSRSYTHLFKGM